MAELALKHGVDGAFHVTVANTRAAGSLAANGKHGQGHLVRILIESRASVVSLNCDAYEKSLMTSAVVVEPSR